MDRSIDLTHITFALHGSFNANIQKRQKELDANNMQTKTSRIREFIQNV